MTAPNGFSIDHLPYGAVRFKGRQIAVARYLDRLLDLSTIDSELFTAGTLDNLLAAGRDTWRQVRTAVTDAIRTDQAALLPLADATAVLPYTVADYVDFYASEQHATNAGAIFRAGSDPLPANWKRLPIGYHARAGTVVVSDTPIRRPCGQFPSPAGPVEYGPTGKLDFEAEVGFVVGAASRPGIPIPVEDFAEHVFGLTLLNDWSARDIQGFETVPLGPHQGKSFATSVAAWITPLDALERAWRPPPARDIDPPRHLDDRDLPGGLDLELTVTINGTVVSRPPFDTMYWTPAQMLAQLTANGAPARTGDLLGSGTISGPDGYQFGSLLELAWGGTRPIRLGAETRSWLEDGDEVVITAAAPGNTGGWIELGEVRGRIVPACR
ncbi:MAG TPA: fumarylacetoacetate hydrolase family protein [Jatrophihabitans sp.]